MELLIAMGIFTVGAIAIAAPMLVAARIQTETIDDILVRQGERNAEAMLRARPLTYDPPASPGSPQFDLYPNAPVADMTVQAFSESMLQQWSLKDRVIGGEAKHEDDGRHLWVPLIRSTKRVSTNAGDSLVLEPGQWQVFVFLMRIGNDADYGRKNSAQWANRGDPPWVPGVRWMKVSVDPGNWRLFHLVGNVSNDADGDGRHDLLRSGDHILDKYGQDYRITEVLDASRFVVNTPASAEAVADRRLVIWYARPEHDGAPSPIRSIRLLEGVVE